MAGPDPYAQIAQQFSDALSGLQGGNLPTTSSPSAGDAKLRMPVYTGKSLGDSRVTGVQQPLKDVFGAYEDWDRMSTEEQRKFAEKLESLGYIKPGQYDYKDLRGYWEDGVDQAALIYQNTEGAKKVSPSGVYDLIGQMVGQAPSEGPSTSTQKQTSYTTKSNARAVIRSAYQQELGRDPNRREVRAFYRALHSKEGSKPSTSTTTVQPNGDRSTVNTGGVDTGAFVGNYVDKHLDAESDSRAAATEWYDALLGLAGGGGA